MADDNLAARFKFAAPNQTTVEEAVEHLGKPDSDYTAFVPEDEIDVLETASAFSPPGLHKRAKEHNVQVIEARVLEWNVPDRITGAKFIFRGERLWYAKYPASPQEMTPEALTARYGKAPSRFTLRRRVADVIHTVTVYAFPELGIAYTRDPLGNRGNTFVFPPAKGHPFGPQCLEAWLCQGSDGPSIIVRPDGSMYYDSGP